MLPETWQQWMEDAGISTVNAELSRILEFMNNQWKPETVEKGSLKINNTSNEDTGQVRGGTSQSYQSQGRGPDRSQNPGRGYGRNNNFP